MTAPAMRSDWTIERILIGFGNATGLVMIWSDYRFEADPIDNTCGAFANGSGDVRPYPPSPSRDAGRMEFGR